MACIQQTVGYETYTSRSKAFLTSHHWKLATCRSLTGGQCRDQEISPARSRGREVTLQSILPIRAIDFTPKGRDAGLNATFQHVVIHQLHSATLAASSCRLLRLGASPSDRDY